MDLERIDMSMLQAGSVASGLGSLQQKRLWRARSVLAESKQVACSVATEYMGIKGDLIDGPKGLNKHGYTDEW